MDSVTEGELAHFKGFNISIEDAEAIIALEPDNLPEALAAEIV